MHFDETWKLTPHIHIQEIPSVSAGVSQEPLVAVTTKQSHFKRRTTSEKRLIILLIVLLILLLLVVIFLAVVVIASKSKGICKTQQCIYSAASMLQSMDESVNPCDDFYKFSCGRWEQHHPRPDDVHKHSWFEIAENEINRFLRVSLAETKREVDPLIATKLKKINEACLDTGTMNKDGLEPMFDIMKDLNLTTPSTNTTSSVKPDNFSFTETLSKAAKKYSINLILEFEMGFLLDDTSKNAAQINPSSNESPIAWRNNPSDFYSEKSGLHFFQSRKESDEDEINPTIKYIASVMAHAESVEKDNVTSPDSFIDIATDVLKLDAKLTEIAKLVTNENIYGAMTLRSFQAKWDASFVNAKHFKLNWQRYLDVIFDEEFEENVVMVYLNDEYLQQLDHILAHTNYTTLMNYLWWKVAEIVSPFTDNEMQEYKKQVTPMPSRSLFCAKLIQRLFPVASSYMFYNPQSINNTRSKVMSMMDDILQSFKHLIDDLDWMDEDTKRACREKAEAIKVSVGFPDFVTDWYTLDIHFESLKLEHKPFLTHVFEAQRFILNKKLELFTEPREKNGWGGPSVPLTVNAFHIPNDNTVTIPIGFLRFPFYDLGLEVLNFAAIGSILGHELTHGFDDIGRQFNKDGNRLRWWSSETVEKYNERAECFVQQYSKYTVPEGNDKVDGELTLAENIADNGGIRESWRGFKRFLNRNGVEQILPGLQKYSTEQLFFISFSQVWCSAVSPTMSKYLSKEDPHAPDRVRVLGTLSNMPEFADVWKCKKGTRMNPDRERCILW